METIINEKGFVATLDKSLSFINTKQIGFVCAEELMVYWNKIKDVILLNRVEQMLVDTTDAKVLPPEIQTWFKMEYFPVVAKLMHGRKLKVAQLESNDVFSKFSIQKLNKAASEMETGFAMQIFESRDLAIEWLKS